MTRIVAWFEEALTAEVAGGKGASLSRLAAAGFPVPPGFVVTAEAYRAFHRAARLDAHVAPLTTLSGRPQLAAVRESCSGLLEALDGACLPGEIAEHVAGAYRDLEARTGPAATFAVRSSAATEDGAAASFAGLYESYLNLRGHDAVCGAVLECYRCLWQPRAVQYRTLKGFDHTREAMAVVVMQTVPAAISGVAFTINPVTGAADEVMVNASWGLGEAIVSGLVNPDAWTLDRHGRIRTESLEEKTLEIVPAEGGTVRQEVSAGRARAACLTPEQLAVVAETAVGVEPLYGGPVDIEFAFDSSGRFYLLQARPVTTR